MHLGDPIGESDETFWKRELRDQATLLYSMIEEVDLAKRARAVELTFDEATNLVVPVHALRKLQTEILDRQAAGEWIGWAWPRLVAHQRAELDAFWARLNGHPVSAAQELAFLGDHAAFIGALLDPTEREKFSELAAIGDGLLRACSCDDPLVEGRPYAVQLDTFLGDLSGVAHVIHPVLLAHTRREGQRFLGQEKLP